LCVYYRKHTPDFTAQGIRFRSFSTGPGCSASHLYDQSRDRSIHWRPAPGQNGKRFDTEFRIVGLMIISDSSSLARLLHSPMSTIRDWKPATMSTNVHG